MKTMFVWSIASLVGSKASVVSGRSTSSQDMKLIPCLFGALLLLFSGRSTSSQDMKLLPGLFGALLLLSDVKLPCLVAGLFHPRT